MSYDDLLAQARDAIDEGRTEAALALCDRALRLDARAPEAYYVKGWALLGLDRTGEALQQFDRCLKLDTDHYEAMLAKATTLVETGEDPDGAYALCDEALARAPDPDSTAWAYEVKVDALMAMDHLGEALDAAERGLRGAPERPGLHTRRAWVLYELGRFPEAGEAVAEGLRVEPDDAYALHLRARVRQRLGQTDAAERDFRLAAQLDPQEYRVPFRLSRGEFEALVRQALREIPMPFRALLDRWNGQVSVMDFPSREMILDGLGPDILGVYQGVTEREREHGLLPDKIILFQRTLENICATREELRREIITTVRHEVGHHFGLSEEELMQIEYGGTNGH